MKVTVLSTCFTNQVTKRVDLTKYFLRVRDNFSFFHTVRVLQKNKHFFCQINVFAIEVTKELLNFTIFLERMTILLPFEKYFVKPSYKSLRKLISPRYLIVCNEKLHEGNLLWDSEI